MKISDMAGETATFQSPALQLSLPGRLTRLTFISGMLIGVSALGNAQGTNGAKPSEPPMQQHYDAAFRLQDSGNVVGADAEHKQFLALVLHHIANARANLGEYAQAAPVYDEAVKFAPQDSGLLLDYAGAALDAGDPAKAKLMAKGAIALLPRNASPENASAISLLAQSLWAAGERQEALNQFEAAAAMQPNFENLNALARTYLGLVDKPNAAKIFAKMQASFGDTAALHMQFGRAYALANSFAESIDEFKKAMAKDDRLPGLHYSLGASYMQLYAEKGYPQAEAEFRKELALHPNDSFTYPQLGRIEASEHKFAEAETDLKRAVQLNPSLPAAYFSLGQLYTDMGKPAEAEAALRKAIAVTVDPTRNNYEGQRIHYALGRLLLEDGKLVEAKKELKIAQELVIQSREEDASELGGAAAVRPPLEKTREAKAADVATENAYEHRTGPLIASSYDNLGVHAAVQGDYATAAGYFEQTALWNPTLNGIDKNWGRAAFAAKEYAHAVGPLSRALAAHPEDVDVRSMLGLSDYFIHDYANALLVLRPIEANLERSPSLALAYAGSMLQVGDRSQALTRLKNLTQTHPEGAMAHRLLGEAYASEGEYELSVGELHAALRLDPTSAEAKHSLSISLIALGQKAEAQTLLSELAEAGSKDSDVYYQLGHLQLGSGAVPAAVSSLEMAAKLNPESIVCHQELAEAYRRNAQPENAAREAQLTESLQAQHTSATLSGIKTSSGSTPVTQKN